MNQLPTEADIKAFCHNLEQSLLAALERGEEVTLQQKHHHEPVWTYGLTPVDARHTGWSFQIDVGAPARQKLQEWSRQHAELKARLERKGKR